MRLGGHISCGSTLAASGYPEFHIYSKVPQLIGGPSSRAIDAVVGEPWTGVVAEFSYTLPFVPSLPYQAQIEWGDGEALTAGTINTQGSDTFTVSGSHTYSRQLNGTIRVLLSLDGWWSPESGPLGTWVTGSTNATLGPGSAQVTPAPLQFDGRPLLAAIQRGTRVPLYELLFRLNRALPQTSSGQVEAKIEASGHASPVRQLTAHTATACYAATARKPEKPKPHTLTRYPFTLVVEGAPDTRDRGYGLIRRFASTSDLHRAVRKQLGCA